VLLEVARRGGGGYAPSGRSDWADCPGKGKAALLTQITVFVVSDNLCRDFIRKGFASDSDQQNGRCSYRIMHLWRWSNKCGVLRYGRNPLQPNATFSCPIVFGYVVYVSFEIRRLIFVNMQSLNLFLKISLEQM
jgi:hypothetical protein